MSGQISGSGLIEVKPSNPKTVKSSACEEAMAYLERVNNRKKSANKYRFVNLQPERSTDNVGGGVGTSEERLFKFSPLSSKKFEGESSSGGIL
jgi:hypothetical protein